MILASLDLWALSTMVRGLGKNQATWLKSLLMIFVVGHFGILALALWWLSGRAFFNAPAIAIGLLVPFIAMAALEWCRIRNVKS